MIRQARNYLLGAASGASLIAAAVIAFVLLVSAQVFEDFPIPGLIGGGDGVAVSAAETADAAAGSAGAGVAGTAGRNAAGRVPAKGGDAGPAGSGQQGVGVTGQQPGETGLGSGGGGGGEAPGSGGGGSTPNQAPGGSSPGTGTGSGAGGSGGGGGGGGGETTTTSTSGKVTGTANETVNQVDEIVTGGALNETGVTQVTEEVVNGVAGPESPVGEVVGAVEGILGGKK